MRGLFIYTLFVVLLFSMGLVIAAKPNFLAAEVINPVTGEVKNTVTLPSTAIEVAPNLYYLGTGDYKGRKVEGYAFVHKKEGNAKPGTECGNGVCEPGENARKCPQDCSGGEPEPSNCFGFLSKGAKWKSLESYVVNPANTRNLSESYIADNLAMDIDKWETAVGVDIIGAGSVTSDTLVADTVNPDGNNEVYFGSISEPGAIAITIVWGYFTGRPDWRELIEWDQVYDQVDYDWSDSGEAGKMDFENIATHELGHSVGLDDLYNSECSEQTMYGYADFGETNKRTLESGDIAGVQELYN